YHGIYAHFLNGNFIQINNNKFINNSRGGIWFQYGPSEYGEINNNTLINNKWGINLNGGSPSENCRFFNVTNNTLIGNWVGMYFNCLRNTTVYNNKILSSDAGGLLSGYYSRYNIYSNNIIESNGNATLFDRDSNNIFINDTIIGNFNDVRFQGDYISLVTFLNSSFNKSKVYYSHPNSTLTVQWYLHVNVIDYLGNPVSNTKVEFEDNVNGSYNQTLITDVNGYLRWIPVTEYIEQDTNGNTIGEKTYYTPHKIVAWNDTLVGYAQPIMNESKTITIILYNGTLLDLEPGWNLVSLPRIQSDTNLPTVLQSIEGQYDAVQWYNITDSNDPWKHNHISKPSNLNDLNEINHTMGLWVHVTDPGGTTLVVFGNVLTSTQNIALYPGWNHVGYPSTTDKIRISALNNVLINTEVDAIWTYNATTQTWKEITASDNFEVGRGYWMHSKVTKTWIVPL
ncbi:MAG: NosD domain-containing protein, partial [Candidatus Hodarchaeales archaeon]